MGLFSSELLDYMDAHTTQEDVVLYDLWRETNLKVSMPQMLSGKQQGKFLEMLSRIACPKKILEIGTYTGYSAICLARGLREDGKLITIDKNDELKEMALSYFKRAGLESRIDLINGDAKEIIPGLEDDFDLVFIDADKMAYSLYLDLVFPKVKAGGLIIADNVLWSGKVVGGYTDKDTQALLDFNKNVCKIEGVLHTIVPLRDGLHLILKST